MIPDDPDKVTGSKAMWQNLIRQLNTFLHSSNGGIVEALRAWKGETFRRGALAKAKTKQIMHLMSERKYVYGVVRLRILLFRRKP